MKQALGPAYIQGDYRTNDSQPFLGHYILRVKIIAFNDDVMVPLSDRSPIIQEVLTINRFFKVSSTLDLASSTLGFEQDSSYCISQKLGTVGL